MGMCLHPDVIDALAGAGATVTMIAAAYRAAWAAERFAVPRPAQAPAQAAEEIRTGPLATATKEALRDGEHPSREDQKLAAAGRRI